MNRVLSLAIVLLFAGASCHGQTLLAVKAKGKQHWNPDEIDKLYLSACSAVQREFGSGHAVRPQLTLVLGADKNEAVMEQREIHLAKWDPYLFAEGVVLFAFEDLMPLNQRLAVARRSVNWASSTVDASTKER